MLAPQERRLAISHSYSRSVRIAPRVELDVRSGSSVWQRTRRPALRSSTLQRDRTTDVLVVGAGISGALVAESLADAGLRVLIVDKDRPLAGATTASTALLQYELDVPLSQLTRQVGVDDAQRLWRRSRLALDSLRQRTQRLGIDAQCEVRDSLYLQGTRLDADGLEKEACARRQVGFETQLLSRRQVADRYGIVGRAGLLSFGNLAANPLRLAAGYLRSAMSKGAELLWPAKVISVEPGTRHTLAEFAHGPVVKARNLVFATGYEIPEHVPANGHSIASTWAMATRPQVGWPTGCLIWEASDPYLYMRMTAEGRVVCGGEDEDFANERHRDALLPRKIEAIRRKLGRLLPYLDTRPEFAWAGSFGSSRTGTPTIGAVPRMPGCYAVMGYGGNGITFSMVAAQVVRGLISGDGDVDADLFAFRRR
jgi:glycine/D-amino acid oxidase-like deaminating enzyme